MDSLDPHSPLVAGMPASRAPRTLGFWRTALWGLLIVAAFFIGQLTPIGYLLFLLKSAGPLDNLNAYQQAVIKIAGSPATVALSAIMGLPGLLIPIFFAVRYTRLSFAE